MPLAYHWILVLRKGKNRMSNEAFDLCMDRIRNGDKAALHEIYLAYVDYLFHLILSIVGRQEDAEDITSELFIRLWKQADRYKSGTGHKRWLSVMAHHMAVDFLEQDISEKVISFLTVEQVLSHLKPVEREIVHLKIVGEETFEGIAELLQMPVGTVTWKYRQAIRKIRRYGYEA